MTCRWRKLQRDARPTLKDPVGGVLDGVRDTVDGLLDTRLPVPSPTDPTPERGTAARDLLDFLLG